MTIGEDAPVSGETLYISAEQALALVAFGDSLALTGFMHSHPQLWPKAAALHKSFDILSEDFETNTCRSLASRFRERLNDAKFLRLSKRLRLAHIEWTDRKERLLAASGLLCEAAATGKLTISGRRGSYRTRNLKSLEHVALPTTFFLLEGRSITPDGWTAFLPSAPPDVLTKWREDASASPDYGDLRFRRDEILALIGTRQPKPAGTAQPATMDNTQATEDAPGNVDGADAAKNTPVASFIELKDAVDRLRPRLFGDDWEPPLSAMENAQIQAGQPGLRTSQSASLKLAYISDLGLFGNSIAQQNWEHATARAHRLALQEEACHAWLSDRRFVVRLDDDREAVAEVNLPVEIHISPGHATVRKRRLEREGVRNTPEHQRAFIGFAEIADACTTVPGALDLLAAFFRNGLFNEGGKSVVVARSNKGNYEDPTITWQEFDASLGISRDDEQRCRLLRDLEVPRAYALRWCQAHGLVPPVGWFTEAEVASAASAGPSGGSQAPAMKPHRNKTGPRPVKRDSIMRQMVQDYEGRADVLEREKVVSLTNTYRAAKDTVREARGEALVELWKNSGKTLDTGK